MSNRWMPKKNIFKLSMLCLMLSVFVMLFSGYVYAADKRTVKVAFFPMDGYHIVNDDGSFDGMDVEYLEAVCEYANWQIEYVVCDSWEDALQRLSEQQVDLVGSAQYSYERAQLYQYADLSSGYTFGVVAVNGDSNLAYEDFTAMENLTYGLVEGYVRKAEFLQYLSDHGIDAPVCKEYANTAELQAAVSAGEIDALVHTFTEVREGQRLIGRFAPRPFYYITYQGNDDVMRELNQAVADLKMQMPELEYALMNKFYYDRFDASVLLTTQEKEYIREQGVIEVGYLDGFYPFSYEDKGEFAGLTKELLEENLATIGLGLSYRKYETLAEAEKALAKGEIDLLSYCPDSQETLSTYQLKRLCEYAEAPLVLVTQQGTDLSKVKELATVSYLAQKAGNVIDQTKVKQIIYETQQECLRAVVLGKEDAAFCNGYLAEHVLRSGIQYSNLQVENVLSGEYSIAFAIRQENEELWASILNKSIPVIDSRRVSEYMLKDSTYPLLTLNDFIKEHSILIIALLLLVMIIIIAVTRHIINDSKKIQNLMYKDTKMNIWNLNYLMFFGENSILPERKENYAVVYINLSQFRRYNVIYGWSAGEKVLVGIADMLKKNTDKKHEICARDQGDRFVLLLQYADRQALDARLDKLKEDIEESIYASTENRMKVRMGIYFIAPEESDLRLAITYANQVLDFMDNEKMGEIQVYDATLEKKIKELHARERLLEAVDINQNFVAYYQSKVDIRTNEIVGAEALVRFLDPSAGGMVRAPGFFVPYYEKTGKIIEIDFFVLESVCKMMRRRMDEGRKVVPVSCNFSRMHFIKPGFPERFEGILEKYQISKNMIEVEITETLIIEELQYNVVKETLETLRARGIRLSIDDFGAGYSSLGVFEQIPASVVKLDRSFLLNQKDRGRQVKIMRGIVKMTEDLAAQVVCEGVETDDDVQLMEEIGAYLAQGYYYSKPIPEAEFEEKLDAEKIK